MKQTILLLGAVLLFWQPTVCPAEESLVASADNPLTAAEQKFAQQLSGAQLVGHFTTWETPDAPQKDTYTLKKVAKLQGDIWMFVARIQYGEHDVTLPLPLKVQWAGDTPVITLDKFPVPGFGIFSSRIVIHGAQYAGTWDGGDHGGHMYGTVVKLTDTDNQPKSDSADQDETESKNSG